MATTLTPPQAAPESPTPQPVVESTPPSTPQQQARTDVYNQYASLYQQPPVVVEPVVETPVVVAPEPVVTAPEPVVNPDIQALQQSVRELQEANARLLQQIPQPAPVVSTSTAPAIHPMQQWVELMAANKLDEAEEFFLQAYGPKFAAKLQPQFVEQSVAANRAEVEIERFVTQFEANNADLLPLRDYVALGAERRLQAAQNEKKITDPASFVREYQKAVTEEANALREKFQLARGAGKQEALTTKSTVLSATTLTPDSMSNGQQPGANNAPAASTPLDYLTMRKNSMLRAQGFGSN